jgi:hypothetical protein
MRVLGWDELEAIADELDGLARQSPEVDGFCSSSAWVLPARAAFAPEAEPASVRVGPGALLLMRRTLEEGPVILTALEAVWGLASPFLGGSAKAMAEAALALMSLGPARQRARALVLPGLADGGEAARALEQVAASRRRRLQAGPETARVVASLQGGVDGFWARRSAKFRATTRRARRHAAAAGITYERLLPSAAEVPAMWRRVLALEARSRKAAIGGGLVVPEMQVFYADMLPRLAARGRLRVVFARRDGQDLAFVMGGLHPGLAGLEYRGLQVSFDDRFAAESPGVLVHVEMIEWLCADGVIAYDLGSDMPYKHRWGEPGLVTRMYLLA